MHWPREGWGNTDTHRNGRDMESQGKYPPHQDPLFRGGDPIIEDQYLVRDSLSKEFKNREQ